MALTLEKGGSVRLEKDGQALSRIRIGLGWDENQGHGDFDLDASAFGLRNGRVFSEDYFIFYNQLQAPGNVMYHMGDDLTGASSKEGDDEEIVVNLSEMHPAIDTVAVVVSIHDAHARRQSFGQVRNAYIRVLNEETNTEVVRYDLTDEASMETAIVFGEVYRDGKEWRFRATGKPYNGGLSEIARQYGVNV